MVFGVRWLVLGVVSIMIDVGVLCFGAWRFFWCLLFGGLNVVFCDWCLFFGGWWWVCGVWASAFGNWCFGVCCIVVRCLLFGVRCLMFGMCCVLFVVCCLLVFDVGCCFCVGWLPAVVCCVWLVDWCVLFVLVLFCCVGGSCVCCSCFGYSCVGCSCVVCSCVGCSLLFVVKCSVFVI